MQKSLRYLTLVLSAFALFLFPSKSLAHLDSGQDLVVGKYLIDFGYAPAYPLANQPIDLAVNLQDNKTEQLIVPDHVWLRITKGDTTYFAGNFSPQGGNVTFKQSLPEPGKYKFDFQFFKPNGILVATTTANLEVGSLTLAQPTSNATDAVLFFKDLSSGSAAFIILVILWTIAWKGFALWKASQLKSRPWFIVLLITNTFGILDIVYLIIARKRRLATTELSKN